MAWSFRLKTLYMVVGRLDQYCHMSDFASMFRFVWLVLLLPCSAHISLDIRRFTLICTHCLFLWPLLKQNKDSLYIFHSLVNRMDGSKILWPCQSLHNLFILEHKKSNWLEFVTSDPWDIFYFFIFFYWHETFDHCDLWWLELSDTVTPPKLLRTEQTRSLNHPFLCMDMFHMRRT